METELTFPQESAKRVSPDDDLNDLRVFWECDATEDEQDRLMKIYEFLFGDLTY
jgi:hypothetical protein